MLCAAPSPRHRRHAKAALEAYGVTVGSKVTTKMATAQACLTAAVKGQKRSTRVQLYKEAGQSAKKGRLATSLSKSLQIDRRTLLHPRNLTARQLAAQEKAEKAAAFLVRDDNSSEMPGKKDQKLVWDNYVAKRTLCETMDNLHQKYKKEYPFPPVSLSVFKRARPEHVLLLQDTKHNMCLCERHENFRLLMAAVPTVRKFSVNEWPLTTSTRRHMLLWKSTLETFQWCGIRGGKRGTLIAMGKGKTAPKIGSSSSTIRYPARISSTCLFTRWRPSPNMSSGPVCSTTQCAPSGSPSSPAKSHAKWTSPKTGTRTS